MNKVEILKNVNELLNDYDYTKMLRLRDNLQKDIREENYISRPTDKKKLATIKKILGSKKLECRPVLQCFTRYDNQVAFTDSYQLYLLNDEFLPFRYASTLGSNEELDKEYAKQHNLEYDRSNYPNLKNVIPSNEDTKFYVINVKEFKDYMKTAPKTDNKVLYQFTVDNQDYTIDTKYIDNAINILKLEDNFTLELRGNIRPITIHNADNELALILPIRNY